MGSRYGCSVCHSQVSRAVGIRASQLSLYSCNHACQYSIHLWQLELVYYVLVVHIAVCIHEVWSCLGSPTTMDKFLDCG
jgi:transposase-like protein